MDIDIKDVIGLSDGRKYVVASKAIFQNNTYYHLIDQSDDTNFKFCIEKSENKSILEVEDKVLIQQLLPLFVEASTNAITKEDLELLEEHQ
ncbi:MAG: hypothetical protein FWC73_02610 [Defluviitaleaceae bacterium]|nr:hypothetical protein [Defluviitaleaceae bacterium]